VRVASSPPFSTTSDLGSYTDNQFSDPATLTASTTVTSIIKDCLYLGRDDQPFRIKSRPHSLQKKNTRCPLNSTSGLLSLSASARLR
jgi:hypothetical protein